MASLILDLDHQNNCCPICHGSLSYIHNAGYCKRCNHFKVSFTRLGFNSSKVKITAIAITINGTRFYLHDPFRWEATQLEIHVTGNFTIMMPETIHSYKDFYDFCVKLEQESVFQ